MLVNKENVLFKLLIHHNDKYTYEFHDENLILEKLFENESILCFTYQRQANVK
jgi:hypothetical protein